MPALESFRYEQFAQEYARTGSSRTAALAISVEPRYAYGLLKRPEIQERIQEISAERMARAELTPERVMKALMQIAFFDPRELYFDDGTLKPVHMLSDDAAAALAGVKVETRMVGRGDEAVPWMTKDIKFNDRMAALTLLAKHFKLVGDEADGVNALANALAARLDNARRRTQLRNVVDAVEVIGGRTDYGMEGDPSNAFEVTPPRLVLPEADPESINNMSVSAADAVHSRQPTRRMEADDEDLSE